MLSFNWVSLIILSGSVIGFFLALVLFTMRKPPRLPHLLLGAFLAAYTISNTGSVFSHSGLISRYPHLFGVFMPFVLLVGPLLYLYILALTVPGFRLRTIHAIHALPFLLTVAVFSYFLYFRGASSKADLIARFNAGQSLWMIEAYLWFRLAVLLAYLALCGLALRSYSRTIRNNFSTLERISLNWLKLLVAAYAAGFVAVLILVQIDVPDSALHICETAVILIIGLRGMTQPEIFSRDPDRAAETKPAVKYEKSSLTREQADRAERLLLAVMENDRLYLEEELSLPALAERIGLATSYVSQVLNERLQKNFYDFVNGYRVEEAQRILRDPRRSDQKILTIAFDSGFASKAAFNRVFKRHTGMTPTEFKSRTSGRPGSQRI